MQNEFWEQRYAEPGLAYGDKPNAFLQRCADQFRLGQKALVIGDGEGRNGVWLAEQGLDVLSVDLSTVGLEKARQLAAQRGVTIRTECADLSRWDWPEGEYDHVVIIYVHFPPDIREKIHHQALMALKPGGQIIFEAFTVEQLEHDSGGPPVKEMLYDEPLVRADFSSGEFEFLQSCVEHLDEGKYHVGDAAIIRARIRRK